MTTELPQISNAPDPLALMPSVPKDLGAGLTAGWKDGIDGLVNGIIHRIGDLGGASLMAAAGKMMDGIASGVDRVASAASSAVNFTPPPSPGMSVKAPDGPQMVKERSIEPSRMDLGNLSPPATPSMGISPRGQGMGIC